MAWTTLTANQVAVQQAGYSYSIFTASGAIKKGQGVYIVDDKKVKVPSTADKVGIGVAMYDADDGDEVAIYGPGCIVNTRVSGAAGTYVGVVADGVWSAANSTAKTAVIVEGATGAASGEGKILIL